jgi:hypothetical protein
MQNFWQRTLHWNPQIYADTPSLTNWDLTPGFLHALEDFAETGDPRAACFSRSCSKTLAASELLAVGCFAWRTRATRIFLADARIGPSAA